MLKKIEEFENKVKKITEEIEELRSKCSGTKLLELKPGDGFMMAGRKFVVLGHSDVGTVVISKEFWGEKMKFGTDRNYKNSALKKYLEEIVLPELEESVGAENILEHEADLTSVDGKNEFGFVKCRIRPITFMEMREYTDFLVNKDLPDYWWTCTPWSTAERGWKYSVAVVSPSGRISRNFCDDNFGVRPVCILKSDLFVSL